MISDAEKIEASNLTLTRDASTDNIYYNCGPEAGDKYTINTPVAGQGDNQWECILVGFNHLGSGTFDEWYDYEPFHEVIVEFGGYAENQDPGGYSKEKEVSASNKDFTPKDAEATINGEIYAPISEALEAAKDGDTIKIVKDQVTAADNATLKKGVTLDSRYHCYY